MNTPVALAQGGTINIGVHDHHGEFTGDKIFVQGDVIVKHDPIHSSTINIGIDGEESNWSGLAFNLADENDRKYNHIKCSLVKEGLGSYYIKVDLMVLTLIVVLCLAVYIDSLVLRIEIFKI